jgi:hypothetical protein
MQPKLSIKVTIGHLRAELPASGHEAGNSYWQEEAPERRTGSPGDSFGGVALLP